MAKTKSGDRQRYWREVIERQAGQRAEHCRVLCPRKGCPRPRFTHGNGDCGRPAVKPGGRLPSRPLFPCRSS